jgi:hypothetical protein
VKILRTVGP